MAEDFKRPAILDELDTYNTAPIEESGSIMQGILNEQTGEATRAELQTTQEADTATPGKRELPNDYLPLNSSIQELTKLVTDKFSTYDRRFDQLSTGIQSYQQPTRQEQTPQQAYYYDPDAPVSMAHLQQVVQAYTGVNQATQDALKESIRARAYMEYMNYKQENPSFKLDPREIDATVSEAFRTGKVNLVKDANWRGQFDAMQKYQIEGQVSERDKRIAELEKELETFKKRPAVKDTTPVSPAVGKTTSRPSAIDTPLAEANDDITKIKSFGQKGNFKGFGNELKRRAGIK
jgi:hypothetical protein